MEEALILRAGHTFQRGWLAKAPTTHFMIAFRTTLARQKSLHRHAQGDLVLWALQRVAGAMAPDRGYRA